MTTKARTRKAKTTKAQDYASTSTISNLIMVKLSIHRWGGGVADRKLGDEVAVSKDASQDSIRTLVRYLPKETRQELGQASRDLRKAWNNHSLPWDDEAWRVIRSDQYTEFMKRIQPLQKKVQEAMDAIVMDYDNIKANATKRLGKLYRDEKFPTKERLKLMYGTDITQRAIARPADIRVQGLDKEQEARLKKEMETELEGRIRDAVMNITERLRRLLDDAMKRYGKEDQDGTRYQGLQRRTLETCGYLDSLNITGDASISELVESTRKALTEFKPIDLRTQPATLNKAKKNAKAVISAIDNFGM